ARGKIAATAAPTNAVIVERLLDEILFQMLFDFIENRNFASWRGSVETNHRFSNWQTLRAYVRGLQALRSYQDTLAYDDLVEALQFFESLSVFAPDDPYGLYFRGLALSENRQEREA